MCSPLSTWFSGLTNKPSGFACSPLNTRFFRHTKNPMVLCAHHQTLGFKAHQKPNGFFMITTNTCIQFRDGQNLFKVYTIEYKKAPLEQMKHVKHIIKIKNKLFEALSICFW